jgi:putative transposase
MDEGHLMSAARYVALNPVRAGLVAKAQDWPWSSVRAHLLGRDDELVAVQPLLERAPRLADLTESEADAAAYAALRGAEVIGRPLGAPDFLAAVARRLGRSVTPRKRGRKPRNAKAGRKREIGACHRNTKSASVGSVGMARTTTWVLEQLG